MTNATTLPVGQKCILAKTKGNNPRVYPTPVEVVVLLHDESWQIWSDGKHRREPEIYRVRELATGVEYPASRRDLRAYQPTPKRKPLATSSRKFVSLALML